MNKTEKASQQQQQQRYHHQLPCSEATVDAAPLDDDEALQHLKKRRASLKRNTTDDSDVERRVARIFHDIDYSVDSVDDSTKFNTSRSSTETQAPPGERRRDDLNGDSSAVSRVEVETQTVADDEDYDEHVSLMRCQQLRFDFDSTAVRLLIKGH